jgi:hypothetical protein
MLGVNYGGESIVYGIYAYIAKIKSPAEGHSGLDLKISTKDSPNK